MRNKKVLIMAGGTGGHVFPGLALAQELRQRGYSCEWLGTERGLESRLVPSAHIHLHKFPVVGIRGRGVLALLSAPLNIVRAVWCATTLIRRIKPTLIVGMGGFVAGPGGLAAKLLGIPLLIHEQNAVAGTTNRLLSNIADRVISAFPVALKNTQVLGNPVRIEIENIAEPSQRLFINDYKTARPKRILVLGGSRGALALNQYVPKILAKLSAEYALDIRHQAGAGKLASAKNAYGELAITADITEFINDMVAALSWADLVICRAGALTVSELAAVGVASVLVPYPYAIDDHQTKNAEYLVSRQAALLIQERDFNVSRDVAAIKDIMNQEKLLDMAQRARQSRCENAAGAIANVCEELING